MKCKWRNQAFFAVAAIGITLLAPVFAAPLAITADLTAETPGAEPKSFLGMVGIWRIDSENGKNVLAVDGRQWKEGQSSAGIAGKARALYGERYAEFLDRSGLRLLPLRGVQGRRRFSRW
jgi:hypothetical protein